MAKRKVEQKQLQELLYQALETERGGIQVYETAVRCAQNEDLREEWEEYLEQTRNHERVLLELFQKLGLDPEIDSPGRRIVKMKGEALVASMEMARKEGDPGAAQLVACEAVVDAETKDHANWELLAHVAEESGGETAEAIQEAVDQVEEEEDEHLYHTQGWSRELWIESLGFPAVLPPPEEEKEVKTAIGAARARHAREEMLK
jgi:rubrerythrin